jgi:hypothetical protein
MEPGQKAKIKKWFGRFQAVRPCPMCLARTWENRDIIVVSLSPGGDITDKAGPGAERRMLRRICKCGYVQLFDADAIGV